VVTKSGGNHPHGSGFYFLRDNSLNAQPDGLNFKPKTASTRAALRWAARSARIASSSSQGPDALIAGQPGNVQNSYGTSLEKASSVTDQRQRFVFSMVAEPNPIPAGQPVLSTLFNHWKIR
jgi:hypothetical protein